MSDFSDRILIDHPRKGRKSRYGAAALVMIPLIAILYQVYVPQFFQYLSTIELPLLVTVYFSLMRRQPVAGILIGAGVGLAQDSLATQPVGMFGIVKTLVGYFAASVSQRFDVEHAAIRLVLGFFFFFFHQFFYWVLVRALLGQQMNFDLHQTLWFALLNGVVAVPLFHGLDKLKSKS